MWKKLARIAAWYALGAALLVAFLLVTLGCGAHHKPNTPLFTDLPETYQAVIARQTGPPVVTPGEDGVLRLTAYFSTNLAMNHRCSGTDPIITCGDILRFAAVAESAEDQYDYVIKNAHIALVKAYESDTKIGQKLVLYGKLLPLTEPWNEYVIGPDFKISAISYHNAAIMRNMVIFTDYEEATLETISEKFTFKDVVLGIFESIKALFTGGLVF